MFRTLRLAWLVIIALLASGAVLAQSTITYQGQLRQSGQPYNGTANLEFRLYDQLAGGSQVGPVETRNNWPVSDGLFQVELDFGIGAFSAAVRFLEVRVDGTPLMPRQAVRPAPVAVFALDGNQGPEGPPGPQGTQGIQGPEGPQGPEGASPFDYNSSNGAIEYTSGNSLFRFLPVNSSPRIIVGHASNEVTADGSIVAGGGWDGSPNIASGLNAVVAGGRGNIAAGNFGAIGGGLGNTAYRLGTVAGGSANCAGGWNSWAGGAGAKVRPSLSVLSGACSGVGGTGDDFGDRGTFVWSDSSGGAFVSTGDNQFLVRATGGMGINTNAPGADLHVAGDSPGGVFDSQFQISGSETNGSAETGGVMTFAGHDGNIARIWAVIRGVKENGTAGNTRSVLRFYTRGTGSAVERMRIDSNGITYNASGSWATFSDRRLKEDIAPIGGALEQLLALNGVHYRYRNPEHAFGGEGPRMGFIAQQVEEVFPQWVGEDVDGYKFINATGFDALMVEALRELNTRQEHAGELLQQQVAHQAERLDRVDELLATNRTLVERNAQLESRLAALEQRFSAGTHSMTGDQQ